MFNKLLGFLSGKKINEAPKSSPSPSSPSDIPSSTWLPPETPPRVPGIAYTEFLGDRRETNYIKKFKTKVVGVTFENIDGSSRQEAISRLKVGQKIRLAWEKDNPHDPNSILLIPGTTGNVKMRDCIGHLNARLAADVVDWAMNKDWCVYAEVAEILEGSEDCETLGCLLEITAYKEDTEPSPEVIPVTSNQVDTHEPGCLTFYVDSLQKEFKEFSHVGESLNLWVPKDDDGVKILDKVYIYHRNGPGGCLGIVPPEHRDIIFFHLLQELHYECKIEELSESMCKIKCRLSSKEETEKRKAKGSKKRTN